MSATLEPVYSTLAADPEMSELVEMFVDDIPAKRLQLRSLREQGRLAEVRRVAHQLRGSAGSYGFAALTIQAGRLEDALRRECAEEHVDRECAALLELLERIRPGRPAE